MAELPAKTLGVFDIDGTVIDHFEILQQAGNPVLEAMAASRGLAVEDMKRQLQTWAIAQEKGPGGFNAFAYAYNNPGELVGVAPLLQPPQPGDERFAHEFTRRQHEAMRFFEGVPETFARMALNPDGTRTGMRLVFLTDGTEAAVRERLALAARAADRSGVLPPGVRFMDLVDGVYCQPDPPSSATPAMPLADPGLTPWLDAVAANTHVLPPGTAKPNPVGLNRILADFATRPADAFMCGDTYPDIGVAKAAGVEGVWQRQGADCSAAAIHYNETIGAPDYQIGAGPVAARLEAKGARPDRVLERGIPQLTEFYRFTGPEIRPEAPQAVPPARPAGLTRLAG